MRLVDEFKRLSGSINESVGKMFGFSLKEPKPETKLLSVDIDHEKGSTEIVSPSSGGVLTFASSLYQLPATEVDLIRTYRNLAITGDVERVLTEIRNEVFIFDDPGKKAVEISFRDDEDSKISKQTIKKIQNEFEMIYNILDFNNKGIEIFDRWYIDGRLFIHKIVDPAKLKEGIQKIVCIDPLKIRKIIEYPQPNKEGVYDLSLTKEYYAFSDTMNVFGSNLSRCMIISKDAICYNDCGIYDPQTGAALGFLWKSIVPYNNLKMMEEALMVYRIVRSPERRVFYINVGNLSKPKAEQYITELMAKFKNKLVYDQKTGTMVDRKNILSMAEDYWLPRRDDGKGTEIQTLPGATSLGSVEDVDIFRKKFMDSLSVPLSRFKEENMTNFVFGRTTETSRDEYRFKKYIDRLRNRFVNIFEDLLKTQLILKKIISEDDWEDIKKLVYWEFAEDNNFVRWKEAEVLNNQIETITSIDPFVGKYFTRHWVLLNVMKMNDTQIDQMLKEAEKEAEALAPDEEESESPEKTTVTPVSSSSETESSEKESQ